MSIRWPGGSVVLTAVVALAFADASIVALALPPIYRAFDTTVVQVSWVLTGYAVAVTVAALAVARVRHPRALTAAGIGVFAAGSLWCGLAGSLGSLLAARGAQGVGAGLLLTGALPVLRGQLGPVRGAAVWSAAATAGLVVGPALGGALTAAFDWRAVFLVQSPAALVALAAVVRRQPAPASTRPLPEPPRPGRPLWAAAGLVTLFAGLVGALFLTVLLLVEVWRYQPLAAALVMSALPAGTLLAGRLRGAGGHVSGRLAGAVVLAAGLAGLALLPATRPGWAAAALFTCGAGAGLLSTGFGGYGRGGALPVAAKHAGLVLGLVLAAPLLSASLDAAGEKAVLAGTGHLLDARLPIAEKATLAMAVLDEVDHAPRGSLPDVADAAARAGAGPAAEAVAQDIDARLRAVLTRAFRPAFGLAAGLALLALVPALALHRRRAGPPSRSRMLSAAALAALVLTGSGLLAAEARAGAVRFGAVSETVPCAGAADPYPGRDLDALVQRVVHGAVNGAACELRISRERLVLSLSGRPGLATVRWERSTVERAVRAALRRTVDDAAARRDIPSWAATGLRALIAKLSIADVLARLGFR